MKTTIAIAIVMMMAPASAMAQNPDKSSRGEVYFFGGLFASKSIGYPSVPAGGVNAGFGGDLFLDKRWAVGAEAGYANASNYYSLGTGSIDLSCHFLGHQNRRKIDPFVTGGYSIYYGNRGANSGYNFGGGVNFWVAKHVASRLEIRDNGHSEPQFAGIGNFAAFRAGVTFR